MHFITIAGKSSADFGVEIKVGSSLSSPGRDVTFHSIPGRNGDLITDNGRFSNAEYHYGAFIRGQNANDFRAKFAGFRAYLGSHIGYVRLEDSYYPDEYRMAVLNVGLTPEMVGTGVLAAEFEIEVNAKPQRFLKSGEETKTFSSAGTLYNPTLYTALPLITVYGSGSGTLTVGDDAITISAIDSYLTIDSETQDAYKGSVNKNGTITYDSFPMLEPGSNAISWSGGVTSVNIVPRWWTL